MASPFYLDTLSASFGPQVLVTGYAYPRYLLGSLYLRPVGAALLSAITFTMRWNDGQARSYTILQPLTSLALFNSSEFVAYMGANTDLSIEATLTGLGSCEAVLFLS